MAFWPTREVAEGWRDLGVAREWVGLPAPALLAVELQTGGLGGSLRTLALLPPSVVLAAVRVAEIPGEGQSAARHLFPVEAAQVGLLWHVARRLAWASSGQDWDGYVCVDAVTDGAPPLFAPHHAGSQLVPQQLQLQAQPAAARKVKVNLVLDQVEEMMIPLVGLTGTELWRQNFITLKGAPPDEEESATDEQLTALNHRVLSGLAPYADFGVFGPFGRKLMRASKFRAWFPGPDGEYYAKERPGPSCWAQWDLCWGVLTTALLSLQVVSAAALERYARTVRRLSTECWRTTSAGSSTWSPSNGRSSRRRPSGGRSRSAGIARGPGRPSSWRPRWTSASGTTK